MDASKLDVEQDAKIDSDGTTDREAKSKGWSALVNLPLRIYVEDRQVT